MEGHEAIANYQRPHTNGEQSPQGILSLSAYGEFVIFFVCFYPFYRLMLKRPWYFAKSSKGANLPDPVKKRRSRAI